MKILVAYDGSEEAGRAVRWAARLESASHITIISVAQMLAASPKIADAVDPSSDLAEHRHELEEAVHILGRDREGVETLLKAGNPAEEIITAAVDGRFDLIIVGIRGMNAVKRFLIGSVADRVVRHATVPVMVVR